MLRRVAIVVVTGVGVLAVTATSTAPGDAPAVFSSPPKSITLVLDAARPESRFVVGVETALTGVLDIDVRADVSVDDDVVGDDDNDGVAVIDVGLLPPGGAFADDVDVPGDASQASVKEGAFGVQRDALVDDPQLVLAVRLREGVASARVTLVLTADVSSFDAATADAVTVSVSPERDAGEDDTVDGAGDGVDAGDGP